MARRKLLALLGAAIVLVVGWRLGAFQIFADPAHVKEALLALGPLGYVVFVLAFGLIQPFGVPGTVFILGAALVWPPLVAATLSLVGATLSTIVGFSFSRYVARDFVAKRIPARLRKIDDKLEENAFATVFFLRLVFWMSPAAHAALGLSKVRFGTHLVASVVAYVPPILVLTYFGDTALTALKSQPRETWLALGAAIVVLGLATTLVRWLRRRKDVTTTEVELGGGD